MITSINEYRQILESINDDLMKLAQQFQKDHPLPADWEGPGDCIEETAAFIMWAETKGMSGRFVKLWGAPLQAKFGAAWMHSVVLDTTSNMVIDLTHDQFDKKIPIRIYSAEEFKEKWPVGIDEEGNYINESHEKLMTTVVNNGYSYSIYNSEAVDFTDRYILIKILTATKEEIGYLKLLVFTQKHNAKIQNVSVKSEYRKKGIYTDLLLYIATYLIEHNIASGIISYGSERNSNSDLFWESLFKKYPNRITKKYADYIIK